MISKVFLCVFSSRSPPRPSPGSLHYSDEDVSIKYNDLVPAESSSLTEKPSEVSDSQVIHPNKVNDFLKIFWFLMLSGTIYLNCS